MSNQDYAEKFERKHIDCLGRYIGPNLPSFPYEPGEIIHVNCIESAAAAHRYAMADAKDQRNPVYA
jgi:hypothetical protein